MKGGREKRGERVNKDRGGSGKKKRSREGRRQSAHIQIARVLDLHIDQQ